MEFKIATIEKKHSAWSAILAFKNIKYMHESDRKGGGDIDYLKTLTRRDILSSIVHHTIEEPDDVCVNRFQFILLLMDDIEEAGRYSKGGVLRGSKSDHCGLIWCVEKNKATVELDYKNRGLEDGKEKYKELEKKYSTQRRGTRNYEIEIKFIISETETKTLNLFLTKDVP